jgi:penicillin-binding protein 2
LPSWAILSFLSFNWSLQEEDLAAASAYFSGGAGVIMDIKTGELLSLTSYPEYNPTTLSAGQDKKTINSYFSDKRKVFLNRAVSGLYTPGSIVKPFIGYGALVENVISPVKQILANGSISIPNPYFPDKKSTFKDHGTFGYVDMQKAIAVSSDVYFYEIGGGFQDQKGLGIVNIDKYARLFYSILIQCR